MRFSRLSLNKTLAGLGFPLKSDLYDILEAAYNESHRFYHNHKHITDCLTQLDCFSHLAENLHEIELALWFHDVVYDTRRNDNEEESADIAYDFLESVNAAEEVIERIGNLILVTKNHLPRIRDEKLIVDVDLSIFGTNLKVFEEYDNSIRKEYSWVPVNQYHRARAEVLTNFLNREAIYSTSEFRSFFERRARENISRKIKQLMA